LDVLFSDPIGQQKAIELFQNKTEIESKIYPKFSRTNHESIIKINTC
jgi:hypothetical protein